MQTKYGQAIREARKAKGYTQEQLASAAGIAINSLSRYENDERQPNIDILGKIADALNMNLIELLYNYNPNNSFSVTCFTPAVESIFNGMSPEEIQEFLIKLPEEYEKSKKNLYNFYANSSEAIVDYYEQLNTAGKIEATKQIERLTRLAEYTTPDTPDEE